MRNLFGTIILFTSFPLNAQISDAACRHVMVLPKADTTFEKIVIGNYPQFNFSKTYSLHSPSTDVCKVDHLPSMFCKIENKIQGKSRIAPRFRLGSLDYTEYMEGKRRTYQAQNR